MITRSQREKFQTLMRGTIISLCQNVLEHKCEIKVEAFIGLTLDKKQDFHFSVVETLRNDAVSESAESAAVTPDIVTPPTKEEPSQPTSATKASSLLERLSEKCKESIENNANREVSREVSSSSATASNGNGAAAGLSYSDLLRSFGEMSQMSQPPPQQKSNENFSRNMDPVNQAQVVIPINFAIHSGNQDSNQPYFSPPLKSARYEREPPDSTYASPQTFSNIKVKHEVQSEEEYDDRSQDATPDPPETAETSSRGILMSLLCDKQSPPKGKKRGRAKKKKVPTATMR